VSHHVFLVCISWVCVCVCVCVYAFLYLCLDLCRFKAALSDQVAVVELGTEPLLYASYALYSIGMLLVMSSFYQLGITGTYLGDYFGW
jgi:Phospholipid methyltransferase